MQVEGIESANREIARWPAWKRKALFGAFGMSDIANQTIRYALSVVLENGNVRRLPRSYKDWNKAAQHGEKLVNAKRIKGFRIVVK